MSFTFTLVEKKNFHFVTIQTDISLQQVKFICSTVVEKILFVVGCHVSSIIVKNLLMSNTVILNDSFLPIYFKYDDFYLIHLEF